MSDELLDRLARENPVPGDLPMLAIEPVLRRLDEQPVPTDDAHTHRGKRARIAPPRRGRLRLPRGGTLTAVVATGVAVLVAGVAIVLLHHRATTMQTSVAPARSVPALDTVATLRSQLAILRRPQRVADRLPPWAVAAETRPNCSNCLNLAKLDSRDTRLLTRIHVQAPGGRGEVNERIYMIVGTPWATGKGHGQAFDGWRQTQRLRRAAHVSIVGFTGRVARNSSPFDELLTGSPEPMPARALNPRDVMLGRAVTVGVIPDGVTRVRWELANPGQKRPAIVYPKLHRNVATAPWTPAPRATALLNEQWLVSATWYDARGRVIASFHQSLARLDQRP